MKKECILNIIRNLINEYFNFRISKKDMYQQLLNLISISEVIENDDELLNESYFAIYHMSEEFCNITNEELAYYKDCIDGKSKFSRTERDKIIEVSSKNINNK